MAAKSEKPENRDRRVEIADVVVEDRPMPHVVLRETGRVRSKKTMAVPVSVADASRIELARRPGARRDQRVPTWPQLYAATLTVTGVAARRITIDVVGGSLTGAIHLVSRGREDVIAAPVEAALQLAVEARAPLYATVAALEAYPEETAGAALLATVLACLSDEDFGEMH